MGKWTFRMWYYTKREANQAVENAKKQGRKQVRITRAKNRNPEGGKYIYNVIANKATKWERIYVPHKAAPFWELLNIRKTRDANCRAKQVRVERQAQKIIDAK